MLGEIQTAAVALNTTRLPNSGFTGRQAALFYFVISWKKMPPFRCSIVFRERCHLLHPDRLFHLHHPLLAYLPVIESEADEVDACAQAAYINRHGEGVEIIIAL